MPPKVDSHIRALPATIPFVAPEHSERISGNRFLARLGANEGNFGCSPLALSAIGKAARDEIGNYCDPECHDLRQALSGHLNVGMQNIIVGPGIDGLLGLIVRIFSSVGDKVLTSNGAYPTFNYHVAAHNRILETVNYREDHEDLDGLIETANEIKPAVIYVSNPDNPMGTWWCADMITDFMDALPAECLLILDEAYLETAPADTAPPIELERPNVLRMRTFSKAYGLAGMRCGYAIGHHDLIAPFEKVRDHFGVNILAQVAARASLKDAAWLAGTIDKVTASRNRISSIAQQNNLQPIPSATNFVTLDCGRDGKHALHVLEGLMANGIFIRKPMVQFLDRCIRVSAGRDEELDYFETALPKVLSDLL